MPHNVSDISIGKPGFDIGPDRLKQLCQFMLNKPELAKVLRALRLLDAWLALVLSATVNLHVHQMRGMEYPFQSHLAIYETVTKLDRLDVLSLYYIGNTCLKAISQLQEGTPELESPTAWLICWMYVLPRNLSFSIHFVSSCLYVMPVVPASAQTHTKRVLPVVRHNPVLQTYTRAGRSAPA
ncbi:hypothetical protein BD311DRAFT_811930 [Dichomitus squalens]|uniref:Uncharacterized protein n=1 Tax=Dichomitus squalens TaxID=114155 RepID=A0A4Q9M7P0_9APHY|nr:hypothetical protein BD311DRAFT_811930 [Dichomitus squalens]